MLYVLVPVVSMEAAPLTKPLRVLSDKTNALPSVLPEMPAVALFPSKMLKPPRLSPSHFTMKPFDAAIKPASIEVPSGVDTQKAEKSV